MRMILPMIFFALFVVLIDVLMIGAIVGARSEKKQCTEKVQGLCVGIDYTTGIKHTVNYHAGFRYEYKGRTYGDRTLGARIDVAHRPKSFAEGDRVTLLVDPDKPSHFILEYKEFRFFDFIAHTILYLLGIFFTFLLVAYVLICVQRLIRGY